MMINYFFNKNIAIILVSFLLALTPVSSFSFQLDKGPIDYDVLFKGSLKRGGKILNLSGKKSETKVLSAWSPVTIWEKLKR